MNSELTWINVGIADAFDPGARLSYLMDIKAQICPFYQS